MRAFRSAWPPTFHVLHFRQHKTITSQALRLRWRTAHGSASSAAVKFFVALQGRHTKGMQYEYFRELVISRMAEAGYRPPGMKEVVNAILAEDKGG